MPDDPLRARLKQFLTDYDDWREAAGDVGGVIQIAGRLRNDLGDLLRAGPAAAPPDLVQALRSVLASDVLDTKGKLTKVRALVEDAAAPREEPKRIEVALCPQCRQPRSERTSTGNGFCRPCDVIFAWDAARAVPPEGS